MLCKNCHKIDTCEQVCEYVEQVLHSSCSFCVRDGVRNRVHQCLMGDPQNLYHRNCDEVICIGYESKPHVYKDIQIVNNYNEFPYSHEALDAKAASNANSGQIVMSDGYTRVLISESSSSATDLGSLLRYEIKKIVFANPDELFTSQQKRALRLYYGLVSRSDRNSFQAVADVMGVSKTRVARHVSVSLNKLRAYIMTNIISGMMNGLPTRLEKLGIDVEYTRVPIVKLHMTGYDRVREFILSTKNADKILTREQFEAIWLFCGIDGKAYSIAELSQLFGIQERAVKTRLDRALRRINDYLVGVVFDIVGDRVCIARDCNNVFTPVNDEHLYCSDKCKGRERVRRYRDRKRKDVVISRCRYCNSIRDIGSINNYCSEECKDADIQRRKRSARSRRARAILSGMDRQDIYPTIRIEETGGRVTFNEEDRSRNIRCIAG